jgi:Na+/H+-dicarboxylate symporter
LVLIVTAYNTVRYYGYPDGFSFVVAIDWFLDRCITVTNVTGDAMVCGAVSHLCRLMRWMVMSSMVTAQVIMKKPEGSTGDEEVEANPSPPKFIFDIIVAQSFGSLLTPVQCFSIIFSLVTADHLYRGELHISLVSLRQPPVMNESEGRTKNAQQTPTLSR